MNQIPLVAIRCTTYNHESYIRQTLEGFIMQQTNFKFVAIVHDDASTDGTDRVISEYALKYPDLFIPIYETENQYSKRDGSISRIMSQAIIRTGAKYVAICEGDDYWTDPLKLQKQVDFLESHIDYSMCFHNAFVHYEDSNKADHIFADLNTREYSEKEIADGWLTSTASLVIRDSVYKSPFYKEYQKSGKFVVGDYPLVMSAIRTGKIFCISDCMSVYRVHAGGWTQRKQQVYKLIIQEIEAARIFGGYVKTAAKNNAAIQSREAISLFIRGEFNKSFKIWKTALQFAPWQTIKANINFIGRLLLTRFKKI